MVHGVFFFLLLFSSFFSRSLSLGWWWWWRWVPSSPFFCTPSDRPIKSASFCLFCFVTPKGEIIPLFVSCSYQLVWKSSIREEKKKEGLLACGVSVACFEEVNVEVAAYIRTTRRLGTTKKKLPKETMMPVCVYSNLCRGTLTLCAHKQTDNGNGQLEEGVFIFPVFGATLCFFFICFRAKKKKRDLHTWHFFSRQVFNRSFLRLHENLFIFQSWFLIPDIDRWLIWAGGHSLVGVAQARGLFSLLETPLARF